ncbi:Protein STRUBBELIG -like protein [Gossypium arboreum]|uniref:Protein STRUBBELIG-like protein n=1 Tax=Gossypium arboreum TaxID=29729 RepID=A0A0B0NUX0_GOSAR|nr:Protein STRUBBELIG -like protein [Gossypium arboreum]
MWKVKRSKLYSLVSSNARNKLTLPYINMQEI